ncbi:Alpha/beta hydrolase [Candidatus Filomicrobium marinum]|uniref:Alpha/beta hydrolase n=1 Tax=Candidatus Filomicrobium marinum TaxID=1608628 RepID=A0A0D6JG51_9HYPH|nr:MULTISPECIES: alpha/beta hydrolase [Filomicrobium]MCV0369965.1 alpha/beta hydrolase [Filomicrobium sp.]CFX29174.1 Alpha/beta hydrolase [Candidatus Filomicrobium marinum]CPR19785.1 Alpha/beta hydrolase [Candidatus Filomicrobium marinum]
MELKSQAKNPVPSGPVVGAFRGYDGQPLRFARWDATQGPRRGTVCLFHGRSEFIEKYFETVADLRRRGFAVATFDWRGQGASYRSLDNFRKGHINDFSEYERDVLRFMKDVVLPDCPPPYIALAHSMGGNVMMRMASMQGSWFERMVLAAPMIAISEEELRHRRRLVRLYAELSVLAGLSTSYIYGGSDAIVGTERFEGNPLTSDRERWSRNKAIIEVAPQLGLGSPTNGWLRAALRSCAKISNPDYIRRINLPILMFAAGEDTVVSTRAIEELGVRLKMGSHILIAGSRHEILQEQDRFRQKFWAAFDAYLGVASAAA